MKCFQEAAQRYTDTSWRIFRQSQKKCLIAQQPNPAPEIEPHKKSVYDISTSSSENNNEKTTGFETTDKENEPEIKTDETDSRKVVEIETVEVLYEPVNQKQVEVELVRNV